MPKGCGGHLLWEPSVRRIYGFDHIADKSAQLMMDYLKETVVTRASHDKFSAAKKSA
jgi:hypothetical protein